MKRLTSYLETESRTTRISKRDDMYTLLVLSYWKGEVAVN